MEISLNGNPHRFAGVNLVDLLAEHAIDQTKPGVAVAVNDSIIPRAEWATASLNPGDTVEIVRPHSGG